jgi:hypothetical protein
MSMKLAIFWDVWSGRYWSTFQKSYCLHHQGDEITQLHSARSQKTAIFILTCPQFTYYGRERPPSLSHSEKTEIL